MIWNDGEGERLHRYPQAPCFGQQPPFSDVFRVSAHATGHRIAVGDGLGDVRQWKGEQGRKDEVVEHDRTDNRLPEERRKNGTVNKPQAAAKVYTAVENVGNVALKIEYQLTFALPFELGDKVGEAGFDTARNESACIGHGNKKIVQRG